VEPLWRKKVREEFTKAKKEAERLLSFYEWYLEDMEIDPESWEWGQIFYVRTQLQKIFKLLLPGTAVTAHREKDYKRLAKRLRKLDIELQKHREFLIEVLDFKTLREGEGLSEEKSEAFKKLWWYFLDVDNPEFNTPFWLMSKEVHIKLKAVIAEGLIDGKSVNILLFTPVVPNAKIRERIEKEIVVNINYDYPTFVYKKLHIGENEVFKSSIFVLPISGLLAKLEVTSEVTADKLRNRRLLVASPKEEGVFRTKFYEELREALFTGNTRFLNEKTLKEEEFDFFDVDVLIGREIHIVWKKIEGKEDLQTLLKPTKQLVGDVVLVG